MKRLVQKDEDDKAKCPDGEGGTKGPFLLLELYQMELVSMKSQSSG